MNLISDNIRQAHLFAEPNSKAQKVMEVMDRLNLDYGKHTLYLASCGIQQR